MICAAIDLGAESCRVSLARADRGSARIQPVHRFSNRPIERDGHLYWDLDRIIAGVLEGLKLCAREAAAPIDSIGIDGWAVDYVWLGPSNSTYAASRGDAADKKPLRPPFCYRDPRTEGIMPRVWTRIPHERLYEITGIQFLRFNTLYQLFADTYINNAAAIGTAGGTAAINESSNASPAGVTGATWSLIPEYILYVLGGRPVAEYTNATHTQLLDARTRDWSPEIFEAVGLSRSAAPEIVPPGTILGRVGEPLRSIPEFRDTRLIAPCCHDTASAVAGIAARGDDWAFLGSGTWSLIGAVLEKPCINAAAREANFSNEGGLDGRIRFLKNVNGMWLLEECMREWRARGRTIEIGALVDECSRRTSSSYGSTPPAIFDADSPELLLPGNMPAKINSALERAGRSPLPLDSPIDFAASIFASLAERYAEVLESLAKITGRRIRYLHVVGGGGRNTYLNALIARRTGLEVIRGAAESSTIGNAAVQFATLQNGAPDPATVSHWSAALAVFTAKDGVP